VSRPGQAYVHFGCCEIKRLDTNILVYIFISLFLRYRSLKYAKHTPVYQLTFFCHYLHLLFWLLIVVSITITAVFVAGSIAKFVVSWRIAD